MKYIYVILAFVLVSNIQAKEIETEQYRVVGYKKGNNSIHSVSNTVKLTPKLHLYIPNAFSPDNDGINDTFFAASDNLDEFKMNVYNRWGELIFTSSRIGSIWDGMYKGTEAPQDAYVYVIEAKKFSDEHMTVFKGTVSLVR